MFAGTLGWLLQPSTRLVSRFLPAHWCIIVKNASSLQYYINARKCKHSNDTLLNLKVFFLQENNFRWPFVAKLDIMYLARCSISNWKLYSLDCTSNVQIHWNVKSSMWMVFLSTSCSPIFSQILRVVYRELVYRRISRWNNREAYR